MDDSREMPPFGKLLNLVKNREEAGMDEEKKEEVTEEKTEDVTEEEKTEEVIEPDFEELYRARGEELDKLHREVTDLKRDKDELQRRLNDATKAFSIIADRIGVIDVGDIVEEEAGGYTEVIAEEDLDKFITY